MKLFRALWLATIVSIAIGVVPRVAQAETTGLGYDRYTRQLWRAINGSAALWLLDPSLLFVDDVSYGPYVNGVGEVWEPVSLTTGDNNYSYVLWRTPSGVACLWLVDENLNYVTSVAYGPYPGWTPEGVDTGTASTQVGLTWRNVSGALNIWNFGPSLNFLFNSPVYGPYAGYDPGPAPESVQRTTLSLDKNVKAMAMPGKSHAAAIAAAARAMARHGKVKTAAGLPQK